MRHYCSRCTYPLSTCLCSELIELSSTTQFHIIQHPNEASAAKNTAKLVKLGLPDTQIWLGESSDDLRPFLQHVGETPKRTAILYPSASAITLNKFNNTGVSELGDNSLESLFDRVILIDATWRKAHKVWMLNPWLHKLPALKFDAIDNEYHVRTSRVSGALSTLESVYHYLRLAEPEHDFSALMRLFHARQAMLAPR